MKILLLSMVFFSCSVFANSKEINIRPNREYMNFVLKGYLTWYKEQFLVDPFFHPKKDYLNNVLSYIDTWNIPDKKYPMKQSLFGQGVNDEGELIYSFRLFVHPKARTRNEWFVEWSPGSDLCYLIPIERDQIQLNTLPYDQKSDEKYFKYDCKHKKDFIGVQASVEKLEKVPYLEEVKGLSYKVYSANGLEESYLESTDLILNLLPKGIHLYASVHMINLMKPLRKMSFNKNKTVFIYYP